jgi:DnaJ-class molecular chaperone
MGFIKSKKAKEREARAKDKVDGYVEQGLQKTGHAKRQMYTERCGHCHGSRVMSNGKPCRNCGGSGSITRYR